LAKEEIRQNHTVMNKKSATEAEKLVREGNLRQLPVLTREKRMVGIVTLEDIARETESDR